MIYTTDLLKFIENTDKEISEEIILVAVGGTAMNLLNLKESTKDIDFCTKTKKQKDIFVKATKDSKFKIDIWYDGYIFTLQLPEDYIEKSKLYKKYKKIELRTLNPIDIILTKTARLNQRDIEDIKTLLNKQKIKKQDITERFNQIKKSIPGSEKEYQENFNLILKEFFNEK